MWGRAGGLFNNEHEHSHFYKTPNQKKTNERVHVQQNRFFETGPLVLRDLFVVQSGEEVVDSGRKTSNAHREGFVVSGSSCN